MVHVGPRGAATDLGAPPPRIDAHAAHLRQVDHQSAVAGREPGDAVTPAADGYHEIVAPREANRSDDVGGAAAADDQGGALVIVSAVPDSSALQVAVFAGAKHLSVYSVAQLLHGCLPERASDCLGHF